MDLVSQFYQLNDEKDTLEVCLILFKKCNLKCAFCFQDHTGYDEEYIRQIPVKLQQQYEVLLKDHHYKKITYRIWGGELFADDIPDSLFCMYEDLANKLVSIGNNFSIETVICFSSNLVFNNITRVKRLLDKTNALLATSYDPLYRFHNQMQIDTWEENARSLKPHTISITLTKQNINAFISEPIHFKRLQPYSVNLEYYIYNNLYEFFKPSEDNLFNFFKYCIENDVNNIPEIKAIVDSYSKPIGRYCSCNNSCLYIDGEITFNCLRRSSNLPVDQFFSEQPSEKEYTKIQLQEALRRKKCMTCKNYSFCRMQCLASVLHSTYDPSNCAFLRIYDCIKEKYGK